MRQVWDQVANNFHVRQWVNLNRAFDFIDAIDTGQRVDAVDVHRARATDTFAARAAEGQCWVDLVLNLDQRVQDHWAAIVHVDKIRIDGWVFAIIWVPAINLELAQVLSAVWLGPGFTRGDTGVFRERKFDHSVVSFSCLMRGPRMG